jgi:hypothetical protein
MMNHEPNTDILFRKSEFLHYIMIKAAQDGAKMTENTLLHALLHTDWISWILHFLIFVILCRWSGIRWQWALIIVFAIEIWETVDWSLARPWRWWMRFDTYADIVSGCLGIWAGERMKRSGMRRS